MDICLAFYWNRVDDNVFETFCKTFRRHHPDALLQVHTDNQRAGFQVGISEKYGINWVIEDPKKVQGCRMLRKLEIIKFVVNNWESFEHFLIADIDLYFLRPVFNEIRGFDYDISLTSRLYRYYRRINGGLWAMRFSPKLISLFSALFPDGREPNISKELFKTTSVQWPDWHIDQDLLCHLWTNRQKLERDFGVKIGDIGPTYNWMLGSDVFGFDIARDAMRKVYEGKYASVLHLKGPLKKCIYEGWLEDAVTCHEKGGADWQHAAST